MSRSRRAIRAGLRDIDAYLVAHGSDEGPLFLGNEPSLAEAATAPMLFRMIATVRGDDNIDITYNIIVRYILGIGSDSLYLL